MTHYTGTLVVTVIKQAGFLFLLGSGFSCARLRRHVLLSVKVTQHLAADASGSAVSHWLLRDFHQRQPNMEPQISNGFDIYSSRLGRL